MKSVLLVDTHVHFYPCFDFEIFFNAALQHFRQAKSKHHLPRDAIACLMLTESKKENAFHFFKSLSSQSWRICSSHEEESLIVEKGEERVVVVAGQQIVTHSRLEVLALGMSEKIEAGLSVEETMDLVRKKGAVPVIPWGFGKWWFKRGEIIKERIVSEKKGSFFLGDNGGRPGCFKQPTFFHQAAEKGVFVLPGSDPLSFRPQQKNGGRCGAILEGEFSWERPAKAIKDLLWGLKEPPERFGKGERLTQFLMNQTRVQLMNRMGIA